MGLEKWIKFLFGLFCVTLFVSIAAMELVSSLIVITFVASFLSEARKNSLSFKIQAKMLLLGAPSNKFILDKLLWSYWFIVSIGSFVHFESISRSIDIIGYARWIVLLYVYVYFLRRYFSNDWSRGLRYVFPMLIFVSVYAIFQMFTGMDLVRGPGKSMDTFGELYRAAGFFSMSLTFAYCVGMAFFVSLAYLLVCGRKISDRLFGLSLVAASAGMIAIVASGTRGAWLALVAGLFLLPLLLGRRWILPGYITVFATLALILFAVPDFRTRMSSITNLSKGHSNYSRIQIWQGHWEIFKDHPIIGSGLAQNNKIVKYYYEKLGIENGQLGHAHNNYLQMLAGTGFLGFLTWFLFCFYFLRLSFRLWRTLPQDELWFRSLALGIFLAQIYHHVGGMTEANFTDGEVAHQLVLLWAVLIGIETRVKDKILVKS